MANQTATQAIITDEQAARVFNVLVSLGAEATDPYGFLHHIADADNYWGGTFEWTDRERGIRMYIKKYEWSPVVTGATVVPYGSSPIVEDKDYDAANKTLAAVFTA